MKLESARLKVAIISGLSSLVFIFLVAAWLEWWGLPAQYRDDIFAALEREGVTADAENVYVGLRGGLRLRNLRIVDPSLGGWPILQAEELIVRLDPAALIRGTIAVDSLQVQKGRVSFPLLKADTPSGKSMSAEVPTMLMHNLTLVLEARGSAYVIREFHAQVENVTLQAQGRIIRDVEEAPPRIGWAGVVSWLHNRQRIESLDPIWRERMLDLKSFLRTAPRGADPAINVHFQLPVGQPDQSRLRLSMLLQNFAWRGLAVQQAGCRLLITPKTWRLEDLTLQLDGSDQEWLQASGSVDPATLQLEATASLRMYPHRLLVMGSSSLLGSPYFPRFDGAPPYVSMRILNSPLLKPEKWSLTAYAEVETVQILEGDVHSARGHVAWDGRQLRVSAFQAILADETRIKAEYYYIPEEIKMILHATVDGNPRFVGQFAEDPEFRDIYRDIWETFTWRPSVPPHFQVDLYRWPAEREAHFVVQGRSVMRDFFYNGQQVDVASAQVTVDIARDLLLINELHLSRNERDASGNLAYHYADGEDLLRFDLESQLDSGVLLKLIDPSWQHAQQQVGLTLPWGTSVRAAGVVPLTDDALSKALIEGTVELPAAILGEATAANLQAAIRLEKGHLKVNATAERVTWRDDHVDQVHTTIETDFSTVLGAGTSGRLVIGEVVGEEISHYLTWRDGALDGRIHARGGSMGGQGGERATLTTGAVSLDDFHVMAGRLEATVTAHDISGDAADMQLFMGHLWTDGEETVLEGTATGLLVKAVGGEAATASLRLHDVADRLRITADADRLVCLGDIELLGGRFDLQQSAGILHGMGRVDTVTVPEFGSVADLHGTFQVIGETMHFQTTSSMATAPQVALHAVEAWGTATADSIVADVSASHAKLGERFDLTDLRGPLTWQNGELALNNVTATAYGGPLKGQFRYDLEQATGSVHLIARQLRLEEMPGPENGQDSDGRGLKGNFNMQLGADISVSSESGLLLYGNGEFSIDNGEIWQFPVLSEFLELVSKVNILAKLRLMPTDELVKISQMWSTFVLEGDRVHFDSIRTNGSLLALTAEGYYWWKTQGVDIRLHAHLLRNILPIPIFKPFMIFFERRRLGTLDNPKWEELTAIRDVFRSDSAPADPAFQME